MSRTSVVLSFHDILLHKSDVELLNGPYWLNDTIISFYFEYLEKVIFSTASDLLFVSPEVTQCVKMVKPEEINTFLEPLDVYKKKFIFFALNDNDAPDIAGGSHWSLLVFSKPENCFLHLDSSSGSNHNVAWDFASHLIPYLTRGGINFIDKECLQQSNGYDCGVHVLCNAERLAECAHTHSHIASCDMLIKINPSHKRKEILKTIEILSKPSDLDAVKMNDSPEIATEDRKSNSFKMSLPTVLCTPDPAAAADNSEPIKTNSIVNSESNMSLPSNLGTPTSPMQLPSPLSLPTSPFIKTETESASSNSLSNSKRLTSPTASPQKTQLVNTGSATGNPRNKCALQPGHSLMDWIRLGNSGKDLTGVGGRIRAVSPKELAVHNKENDAWLAIRGRVYNITHYLSYHPGGPEEIMRGAGMDATQLFDKVHPWVNYDSLLAKCLVGPLRYEVPDVEELFDTSSISSKSDRLKEPSKAQELVRKSMENLANCITPVRKKMATKNEETVKGSPPSKIMQSLIQSSDLPVSISRRAAASPAKKADNSPDTPQPLRYDWIQTSTKLTIYVYTGPLANPGGCVKISEGFLMIEVATNDWLRTLKIVPEAKLREPLQLRVFAESGKIEITAFKEEPNVWKGFGEATLGIATRVDCPRTVECRVTHVDRVSHDTTMISVAPRPGPVVVPIGHHVRVHRRIEGLECARSYTPVGDGWGPAESSENPALRLAVKRYDSGTLSPHLTALREGDTLSLSGPYGNFQLQKLKSVKTIYLLAAGTGITPMLGLIKFMLSRSNPRCERVHLMFFNKTENDILFNRNFEEMASEDERLKVTNVLSDASSSWQGYKGRVDSRLLTEAFGMDPLKCSAQCTHYACLCGPIEFTQTGLELLQKLGMKDRCLHAFMG